MTQKLMLVVEGGKNMKLKEIKKDKNLKASFSKTEETEKPRELSEEELKDVSGGTVRIHEFHFAKKIDKASHIF
ncbi:MAG TPA: hypothetical protein VH186_12045 [Chloroflexia bacterium]|nr:hypothetical protein [Chloroflexia bacterium]